MRICELTLATGDVAGQSMFWGETLGLPVRDGGSGAIEVSLQVSILRFEQASPGADPRYHFAINVPRGSIEEAAAWIEERHELLAFHADPDEEEGATIAHTDRGASALYFLDAAGNVVELIANDHLDNESDTPFGPGSFLEIAEIGVATADTEATCAAIQEALSAEILWGGREGWLLTAIGDDHGVIIVARLDSRRLARAAVTDDDRCGRATIARTHSPRGPVPHPRRRRALTGGHAR